MLDRWLQIQERLAATPARGPLEELLWHLVLASRLNEAAGLLATQDLLAARLLMAELESVLEAQHQSPVAELDGEQPPPPTARRGGRSPTATPRALPSPPSRSRGGGRTARRIGQPIGPDGRWMAAYGEARDVESRLQLLRSLRNTAGTDLGPVDAEMLVREAYRGTPQEVRELAQDMIVELFDSGPSVAMELLDQLPDASANEMLSDLIGRVTQRLLPPARAGSWEIEAMLALVEHALSLRRSADLGLDETVAELTESYRQRARVAGGQGPGPSPPSAPQDAAALLTEAWAGRAEALVVASPVPDDLAGLDRRRATRMRLVDGPIQHFVAWQVTVLDLLAYVTAAEQPARAAAAAALLADGAADRAGADDVLIQAILTELAMAEMWRLRMRPTGPSEARLGGPHVTQRLAPPTPRRAWAMLLITAAVSGGTSEDWADRLAALEPGRPMDYFELGEEIADAAAGEDDRDLARRLFALAGVLDRFRLGRSSCLALADLEEDPNARRRLQALAGLLGDRMHMTLSTQRTSVEPTPGAALSVARALSHYRRGQGSKALDALEEPGATALLEAHQDALVGGLRRFVEDCKLYRGRLRPSISETDIDRMLHLELLLLAGINRPWSSELVLGYAFPLIEVDPERLEESLRIDASRCIYRDGRWIEHES
jgi:hypothetical protein